MLDKPEPVVVIGLERVSCMDSSAVSPGLYRHYKGRDYLVLGIARHSETEEAFVVYRQNYGDHSLWIRPLAMFTESVTVDGQAVPRFRRLSSAEAS